MSSSSSRSTAEAKQSRYETIYHDLGRRRIDKEDRRYAPVEDPEITDEKNKKKAEYLDPDIEYDAKFVIGDLLDQHEQRKKMLDDRDQSDFCKVVCLPEEELYKELCTFRVPRGHMILPTAWNPLWFPVDGTMVAFGRRRTGKSFLFRFLLCQYAQYYRVVVVITNTFQNEFWSEHVPVKFIHSYSKDVIQDILTHQRRVVAWNKLYPDRAVNPYMAVVLDDVVTNNLHHDALLKALFYEGRHSNIAVFISTQHPKALPPGVRSNADAVAIFPQYSEADMETVREQYCNFFEHKDDWHITLHRLTQNYQTVILDMGDTKKPQLQNLYVFTSAETGPFLLGSAESWENDAKHRKERWEAMAGLSQKKPDNQILSNELLVREYGSNAWVSSYLGLDE
jgi:hypothetical protein